MSNSSVSVFTATLSFISTLIGSGMISLPYAMANAGLGIGLVIHLSMVLLLSFTALLYLKIKDNL